MKSPFCREWYGLCRQESGIKKCLNERIKLVNRIIWGRREMVENRAGHRMKGRQGKTRAEKTLSPTKG